MPRERSAENRGLPARWSIRRGKYYFSVPPGREGDWDGKKLFPLGPDVQTAYRTYAAKLKGDVPAVTPQGRTLNNLFDRYLREVSPNKAPRSFTNDQHNIKVLRQVFGHIPIAEPVRVHWCHEYIDQRKTPSGVLAPVQGRKEIALLSAVLSRGVRWGTLERNPLIGQFRREQEKPRERDVTIAEIEQFKLHAPMWLRAYLDVKLLLGIRQADMLALRESSAKYEGELEGVLVVPSKTVNTTGQRALFTWTEELRDAWKAALAARPEAPGVINRTDHLFRTRNGTGYSADSFGSTWQRVMAKAVAAGTVRFHEHDIRATTAAESGTLEEARVPGVNYPEASASTILSGAIGR